MYKASWLHIQRRVIITSFVKIFRLYCGCFSQVQPWWNGKSANVQGGWGLSSKCEGPLRLESVWDGTVGGLLTGRDGGDEKNRKQETEAMPTAEAGSGQSHESNDRRQWADRVHCCLEPPHPPSMSLSVWAKVKHWQLGGKNKHCCHKPAIKWSHKWQDRPTVFAAGLGQSSGTFP